MVEASLYVLPTLPAFLPNSSATRMSSFSSCLLRMRSIDTVGSETQRVTEKVTDCAPKIAFQEMFDVATSISMIVLLLTSGVLILWP